MKKGEEAPPQCSAYREPPRTVYRGGGMGGLHSLFDYVFNDPFHFAILFSF